jgi:hypothetical protein
MRAVRRAAERPARRSTARLRVALAACALVVLAIAGGGSPGGSPAAAADGWLADLHGDWSGRGRFMGNDAEYRIGFAPALDGRFVRINVRYTWREASGGETAFAGEALYPAQATGMARGSWFDSEGHQYSTSAYRERGALIVHWGDGATLAGRTEYRLDGNGGLQVLDNFRQGDKWTTFSQAALTRGR